MIDCNRCGDYCKRYTGTLSTNKTDLDLWKEKAPYILDYVEIFGDFADLWFNPVTRRELDRCPWLTKNQLGLYVGLMM